MKTFYKIIGSLFILSQLLFVTYSQLTGNRYACWAPHDIWVHYEILGYADGHLISDADTKAFFGNKKGRKDLPPDHLFNWVNFGLANNASNCDSVIFIYSVNLMKWDTTTIFPNYVNDEK